ncbi:unnamed protein product [marine sediment metagenome]|uniref:Uncharacterized protein n=1 Tax=marine sediment metagenome TaxID=412755 RepID=X1DNR8_9ZZZZ
MTEEIKELWVTNFDNMENQRSDAITKECVGTFIAGEHLTAHGKADKYIKSMKPINHYLGWNGIIYPKFEIITRYAQ